MGYLNVGSVTYRIVWHSCDGRGDGYIGAVVVLVTDADVDVVARGANRTGIKPNIEGVKELDKSEGNEGNGNKLGSALHRPLLFWLNFFPNSPLLLARSQCFRIE